MSILLNISDGSVGELAAQKNISICIPSGDSLNEVAKILKVAVEQNSSRYSETILRKVTDAFISDPDIGCNSHIPFVVDVDVCNQLMAIDGETHSIVNFLTKHCSDSIWGVNNTGEAISITRFHDDMVVLSDMFNCEIVDRIGFELTVEMAMLVISQLETFNTDKANEMALNIRGIFNIH
ncbi:hypothetical protein [Photobacterium kishitanii]|uniref:Uncharacterized protein n=1 Tax=Photobacterium kishitanii TaxID=318456 RepID=A0A2T3KLY0_9GAMM|nr:hypothetical protein [Photobacterium kishitanii]PSV00677.1 hypothetical protein C9J27_05930 [Photobacterium kishitanii]